MFETQTIVLLLLLVFGWLTQILLSTWQMRRFHGRSVELKKLGTNMSIGVAGNIYRRKTYVIVVTDLYDEVVAAERLTGFTVFATLKPVPEVVGLHFDDLGKGDPPAGVDSKTWAAFDHAAGFIRRKKGTRKVADEAANERADREGGAMG